jgi:hypothetical protein
MKNTLPKAFPPARNFIFLSKYLFMRKLYLVLLLISAALQSQNFEWVQTTPTNITLNPDLIGYSVAVDPSGNVYACGFEDQATPYNDIFGQLFYNKYNDAGELQFSKTFSGKAAVFDIAADGAGNIILALGYLNTISIDGLTLSTVNQGVQPLVVKFNSNGELQWHYIPLINGDAADYFKAVTIDDFGNVYAGYDDFNASYIEKISAAGVSLFKITQTHARLLSSLDTDIDGNLYAAGSCAESDAVFAGVPAPTSFDYNTWLVKYSPSGTCQWVRYIDDITCSHPEVKVVSPEQVYFGSYLFGPYAFGSFTATGPSSGSFNDFFITQLDAAGTFQWVREVPGTGVVNTGKRNYLESDAVGNVYFAGSTRGSVDWGSGITTTAAGFGSDALVLKYNASGILQFAKTAGGMSEDRFDGITANEFGDLYLSGIMRGNATFDAITHISAGIAAYPVLAKISNLPLATTAAALPIIHLYPNPATDYFYMAGSKMKGSLFNVLGQKIRDFESDGQSPIAIADLPHGIYLVKGDGFSGMKLIKE